jgi:two-component system chemotaxis response regulator CheY
MSSELSDKKVLVVDDYSSMRQIIKKHLKEIGVQEIDEAEDGDSALQKLQDAGDFDIVVSDWNMERVSGYELLQQVRASSGPEKDVVFLMVTAEKTKENVKAAKDAGVNGYIGKPFGAEQLQKRLVGALQNA